MPRHSRSSLGIEVFVIGQRVRITAGPLRDLRGVIENGADGDRVVVNAGDNIPGLCVRISPALLEPLD